MGILGTLSLASLSWTTLNQSYPFLRSTVVSLARLLIIVFWGQTRSRWSPLRARNSDLPTRDGAECFHFAPAAVITMSSSQTSSHDSSLLRASDRDDPLLPWADVLLRSAGAPFGFSFAQPKTKTTTITIAVRLKIKCVIDFFSAWSDVFGHFSASSSIFFRMSSRFDATAYCSRVRKHVKLFLNSAIITLSLLWLLLFIFIININGFLGAAAAAVELSTASLLRSCLPVCFWVLLYSPRWPLIWLTTIMFLIPLISYFCFFIIAATTKLWPISGLLIKLYRPCVRSTAQATTRQV